MKRVFMNKTPGMLSIQQIKTSVGKDQIFEVPEEVYKEHEQLFKLLLERKWIVEVYTEPEKPQVVEQKVEQVAQPQTVEVEIPPEVVAEGKVEEAVIDEVKPAEKRKRK